MSFERFIKLKELAFSFFAGQNKTKKMIDSSDIEYVNTLRFNY